MQDNQKLEWKEQNYYISTVMSNWEFCENMTSLKMPLLTRALKPKLKPSKWKSCSLYLTRVMKHFLTTRTYLEASNSKRNSRNNSHFWLYNGHHLYKTTLMEEKKKTLSTAQTIINTLITHLCERWATLAFDCSFIKIYSFITNPVSFEEHRFHLLDYAFKCEIKSPIFWASVSSFIQWE